MDESSTFLREKENIFPLERKLQMGQLNLLWIVAAAILNGLMARKKIPLFACFKTGGWNSILISIFLLHLLRMATIQSKDIFLNYHKQKVWKSNLQEQSQLSKRLNKMEKFFKKI